MTDPADYSPPMRKQIAFLTTFTPRSPFMTQEVEVSIDIDHIRVWRTVDHKALVALPVEERAAWAQAMAHLVAEEIRRTIEAQAAVDLQKELDVKFPCVI